MPINPCQCWLLHGSPETGPPPPNILKSLFCEFLKFINSALASVGTQAKQANTLTDGKETNGEVNQNGIKIKAQNSLIPPTPMKPLKTIASKLPTELLSDIYTKNNSHDSVEKDKEDENKDNDNESESEIIRPARQQSVSVSIDMSESPSKR